MLGLVGWAGQAGLGVDLVRMAEKGGTEENRGVRHALCTATTMQQTIICNGDDWASPGKVISFYTRPIARLLVV